MTYNHHGSLYISDNNTIREFLYLENPNSLVEKINYLEENPEEYKSLYNKLQGLLKPEYFSGEFLNNRLMKELDEIYNSI
mgnify:CR=1 FL=1